MPERWIDEHVGDEVNPRAGFEDELAERLGAAWHGRAPAPVVPSAPPAALRRRRRWVAALGAAAALIAILTVAVLVRDRGTAPEPVAPPATSGPPVPTAAPPATTAPPATSAPTTSATTPTTSTPGTEAPGLLPAGFRPACTESPGTAGGDSSGTAGGRSPGTAGGASSGTAGGGAAGTAGGEEVPDAFGPLQAEPALTITLPESIGPAEYVGTGQSQIQDPTTWPLPVPGGVLVPVRASSYGSFDGSILAVVNLDGTTRWVRCYAQNIDIWEIVGPSPDGTVLVPLTTWDGIATRYEWRVVSLADGTDLGTLADEIRRRWGSDAEVPEPGPLVGASDRYILFSDADGGALEMEVDTWWTSVVPPYAGATAGGSYLFARGWVAFGRELPFLAVDAAFQNHAWVSAAESDVADVVSYGWDASDGGTREPLQARDAVGRVLWDASIGEPPGEGFRVAQVGDVVVARGCFDTEAGLCDEPAVVGVRASNGDILWRLDGFHDVGPLGGGADGSQVGGSGAGYVLLGDEAGADGSAGGWTMLDVETGQPVPGQRWDDHAAFASECCGGGDFVHTSNTGGVVVVVDGRTVNVWYPAGSDLTLQRATIP